MNTSNTGEREAAARARERILERLEQFEKEDPPLEYRFSMGDMWSRKVFVALLRRYGIPASGEQGPSAAGSGAGTGKSGHNSRLGTNEHHSGSITVIKSVVKESKEAETQESEAPRWPSCRLAPVS